MIDESLYKKQIERLEAAFMYEINPTSLRLWKTELEEDGIENTDLATGITYILNNAGKFTVRPHLGTLIEWCNKAKQERWEREEAAKKTKLATEILKVKPNTDHGMRALKLIKLILKGSYMKDGELVELTKRDKVDYMLKMEEYYSGNGWQQEAMKLVRHYKL